ncbi:MAG TPA: aminoglycoside phosphotransferase family protein [Acidimicrobiales bacterium]
MHKGDITVALVEGLIAEQFPPWADLPVHPVELDGIDNTTFRLGDQLSVRLPSAEGYAAQVEKEQRWLPQLAPQLPLPISTPVAQGRPGCGYPWAWSVYRWIDGETATVENIADLTAFAAELAGFLVALYRIDGSAGPPAGPHSFDRGGPLTDAFDTQVRQAIDGLGSVIDGPAASALWQAAWDAPPPAAQRKVWAHGDITGTNLLVREGQLAAVIDFGTSAVGDPACDLTIAWTLFSGPSRQAFRSRLELDEATWARGAGWALWKALITLHQAQARGSDGLGEARRWGWRVGPRQVIEEILGDTDLRS